MTAPVVQLFVLPRIGWLAQRRTAALRRAFEQLGAAVILTESVSDQLEIDERATHVCAVGGDGTLRHVVEALHRCDRPVPISAYPAGTVNLLARERGYPRSPLPFVQRVLSVDARTQRYTALVGGTPMMTCASVGPDSFVVEELSPDVKNRIGRAAYILALCRQMIRWQRATLALSWIDEHIECEAVYIAKGRFFAGPWSFAPHARATDPLLHVVSLKRASRLHFAQFAWTLFRGRPVNALKGIHCFHCTELTISSELRVPLQADGDIVAHLPATISVRSDPTEFA